MFLRTVDVVAARPPLFRASEDDGVDDEDDVDRHDVDDGTLWFILSFVEFLRKKSRMFDCFNLASFDFDVVVP